MVITHDRLDVKGKMCPIPVLLTKRRLQELHRGRVLEIVGDDPQARDHIERWARDAGHEVLEVNESQSEFTIRIRKV